MPSAMLKVSGNRQQRQHRRRRRREVVAASIPDADCIMKMPTTTSAGAVAAAGTARNSGVRNSASRKHAAVVSVVSPVRPPASTPEADSM